MPVSGQSLMFVSVNGPPGIPEVPRHGSGSLGNPSRGRWQFGDNCGDER